MTKSTEILTIQQARKLVLLSQRIPPAKQNGSSMLASLTAIEHLGYIQIDTISTIQRAHHHTIWNRNPRYKKTHIKELMLNKDIFEYWSHAASYLPMKDFRYSLLRKNAIKSGKQKHWYKKNEQLMQSVLDRIKSEGPLMAKDFENVGKKIGVWETKPAKQALESLYMQGELMVAYRNNFHKVYDLTERVLPNHIDTSIPSKEEYLQFLITRYLRANGLGQAAEIAYLLKNTKTYVINTLQEMTGNGTLVQVVVDGENYYALTTSLELLNQPLSKSKLKFLSPFDNLIIQRKRAKKFFDFDYILECYVPEPKRVHGYFVLPILWNGKLVARMDCKADRKSKTLIIHRFILESHLKKIDAFVVAFCKELEAFMEFNNCNKVEINQVSPDYLLYQIQSELKKRVDLV